jgi:mRNA interferase MazF
VTTKPFARRGEIWWVNLDPTVGAEIQKRRPGLVISSDYVGRLPMKVVVPITEWNPVFSTNPWHVELDPSPINGLTKKSAIDALQIRSVSLERFSARLGRATADQLEEVLLSIRAVLEIKN